MLQPIETLNLSKTVLSELVKSGYQYVQDVENAGDSIKKKYGAKVSRPIPATLSALDLWKDELQQNHLTTLSKALDNILEGGFRCRNITEICGGHGSGKTQICMQMSVASQLSTECGGLEGQTLYIDSRNGFSPTRVQDLIEGIQKRFPNKRLNVNEILRGIDIVSPGTPDELFSIIVRLKNHLRTDSKIRLVIIDSLSFPVQCSIADASQRTQFYFRVCDELVKITTRHNVAVIVVNELHSHIDSKGEIIYASAVGQLMAHRTHKRLVVARLSDSIFAARILKSTTLPQLSVKFRIIEDGLDDNV